MGDTLVIKWTFIDSAKNANPTVCYQTATVKSQAAPVIDCDSLMNTVVVDTAFGACTVEDLAAKLSAVAKDSCTGTDVKGTFVITSNANGKVMPGPAYPTGEYTITWTFVSPYSVTPAECTQPLRIISDNEIDADCENPEKFPPVQVAVDGGVCEIEGKSVYDELKKYMPHTAEHPCNPLYTIEAVGVRSDSKPGAEKTLEDKYPVGITTISWIFRDETHTLVVDSVVCTQKVTVGDNNEPPVDCKYSFPDTLINLDPENCFIDLADIPVHLDTLPVNPCNGDIAVLDTVRASGAKMTDPYYVGSETITWTFTYPSNNQSFECTQHIEVKDTTAPDFDCNQLEPVITVAFTREGQTNVSYDELVENGFKIPTVADKCDGDITAVAVRSDGKEITDPYGLGTITVTFTFTDKSGNSKPCSQKIHITDMIPPEFVCPAVNGGNIACMADTASEEFTKQYRYLSIDEFLAAGGTLSDISKVKPSSFTYVDKVTGNMDCNATIVRTYSIEMINDELITCENPMTFSMKDSIAPEYILNGVVVNGNASVVFGCDDVLDEQPEVTASDNCDPDPKVTVNRTSTQGTDPSKCDYYTYDIVYTFQAEDRCGNQAAPFTFTIAVKDTVEPDVHKPQDWDDVMHPTYLKNCEFGVPDITSLIPSDSIYQNCGSNKYLKFSQDPVAGSLIYKTTDVHLYIEDVCGNVADLVKTVKVQEKREIITVITSDDPVCGSDSNLINPRVKLSLASSRIRTSTGVIWAQDWDGSWVEVPMTSVWDCYRATSDEIWDPSVASAKVVYSNNPNTYGSRFTGANARSAAGDSLFAVYNSITRRSQSDVYTYVATDTVSGCSDTAMVNLDVREKPRIALVSGSYPVCDGDSIALNNSDEFTFEPCIEDMGAEVTREGWMLDSVIYSNHTPVYYDKGANQVLAYYATNECGTTTTLNTLLPFDCEYGDLTAAQQKQRDADKLYVKDSVDVVVYRHYNPADILLTTDPVDKARVWKGDDATLVLNTPYDKGGLQRWFKVVDEFDGMNGGQFDRHGDDHSLFENNDEEILTVADSTRDDMTRLNLTSLSDSATYYVLVGNGVCPAVASNLVSIDVMKELPTAITPHNRDGLNDVFMKGHKVYIFNRYGQLMCEGNDGWDGRFRGTLADPGVYFYEVKMKNGVVYKGSIEVVKMGD